MLVQFANGAHGSIEACTAGWPGWARRIEIPVIERPDRLLLRVSHHFYTTEGEIDRLAGAVPAVLAAGRGALRNTRSPSLAKITPQPGHDAGNACSSGRGLCAHLGQER